MNSSNSRFFSSALALSLSQGQLAGFIPETVITGEHRHFAEINIHRMGTDGIQEVTVVAYYQYRVLEIGKV